MDRYWRDTCFQQFHQFNQGFCVYKQMFNSDSEDTLETWNISFKSLFMD
jgi:hypothetical protein